MTRSRLANCTDHASKKAEVIATMKRAKGATLAQILAGVRNFVGP